MTLPWSISMENPTYRSSLDRYHAVARPFEAAFRTTLRELVEAEPGVLMEVNPGCEWVFAGEGVATRKYDGTCVMLDENGDWWARREVKPGKSAPSGWVEVAVDDVTGKRIGWEPIAQSPFAKFHAEALSWHLSWRHNIIPGTYELIGPKINGNPEREDRHKLVRHAMAERPSLDLEPVPLVRFVAERGGWEGIVWHHPDGCMAKLKGRDLR